MAITKSAKKALRQNLRRKIRNLQQTRKLKSLIKEAKLLISEKKSDDVKKIMPQVYKYLDKAAKTNLLKKNTASRLKSRLTKATAKLN